MSVLGRGPDESGCKPTVGRFTEAGAMAARRSPPAGLGWAGPMSYRGLGWALRACDGARADELSKDYRALRT